MQSGWKVCDLYRFLHYVWLQWMYTLMVEPLFSTTSTGVEVWLVLCELCLSHPSVDVYAHLCWKWMETHMV
jgi:hypothetical protein